MDDKRSKGQKYSLNNNFKYLWDYQSYVKNDNHWQNNWLKNNEEFEVICVDNKFISIKNNRCEVYITHHRLNNLI